MERSCIACGKPFTAQRSTAKYCSGTCRSNASTGRVVAIKPSAQTFISSGALKSATLAALEGVGRADTPLGIAALELAGTLESVDTPPAAKAGLTREFRATLADALKGTTVASTVDELRRKRAERRTG